MGCEPTISLWDVSHSSEPEQSYLLFSDSRSCWSLFELPKFPPSYAIIGCKKQGSIDVGQVSGARAGGPRVNIFDQHCARRRAVGFPELPPRYAIIGCEEESSVDAGRAIEIRALFPGADVLDQHRASRRTVGFPELIIRFAIVGRKEQGSVDVVIWLISDPDGEEPTGPKTVRLMSLTNTVPAAVPSDFQSSRPVTPSSAGKNRVPLT